MPDKILIFKGGFQYGVVDDFITGILEGVSDKFNVVQVDLSNKSTLASVLNDTLFDDVKVIISINALGSDLIPYFPIMNKILFYTLLVDHPLHSMTRFYGTNMRLLCVDKDHVNFARLVGMDAQFFPHAARVKDTSYENKEPGSKEGILFPASYFNLNDIKENILKYFPQGFALLNDGNVQNINDFLLKLGFMDSNRSPMIQLNKNSIAVLIQCDLYLRARKREQIINEFADHGLNLNIIGNGWSSAVQRAEHTYLEAESFNDLIKRIINSKFILHHSPGFNQGLHERITYPLLHKTLVITSHNSYLHNAFEDEKGIVFYNDVSEVKSYIKSIDDEQYKKLSLNGADFIKENHIWSNKIFALLQ